MQKKIEIILTPKENSNGYNMEFIVNKDEFDGGVLEVTSLFVSAAYNFGYKNLDTMQFIAFLEATKDMSEKQKGLALLNNLLKEVEEEKTNE
ncbi:hypothetical protein [Veillonella parvula]|uniref:hypothetical protein n=1 Tax=Veillonella parvula TaxID=29466 RepID=UPI00241D4623|nr:hypothetical protein [Veillonella parvula]